jgi:hypothetical protein
MPSAIPASPFPIFYTDGAQLDAFGRVRVGEPQALFSSKLLYDNQPLVWDDQQVSGGSTTSTFNTNQASVTLLATGNIAGRRTRQTFRRFNYQPGKSQLVVMTGVLATTGTGAVGIKRRMGLLDDNNGYYFEYGGSTMNVGLRTFTSGVAVSTLVAQTNWNIDKFDGTGPSKITLDVTRAQIFVIDFQWFGTGRIRYGFNIGGQLYYCHQTLIANVQVLVSIQIPNLPLRYEVVSDGSGSAATATMTQVCASVVSEGGADTLGFPFSADTGSTALSTGNNTLVYALLALQFQAGKTSAEIILDSFTVFSSTNNAAFRGAIILNPTIAGAALVYTNVPNSVLKVAPGVTANTLTGGTPIFSGYFSSSKSVGGISQKPPQELSLGSTIAGVSDTLVLAVEPIPSGAFDFFGSMNWREEV